MRSERRASAVAVLSVALSLLPLGCDLERRQALRALSSPDAPVRARALHVLALRRDARLGPAIAKLLDDPVPRVRQGAVAALGAVGLGKQLHPLIERLRDDDLEVRLAAVRVLGDSRRDGAQRALLPLVRDPSMVVRRAAAQALVALGVSLKEQGRQVAAAQLAEELQRLPARDEQVRAAAARALGRSGRPAALTTLLSRLADPSELVQRAVAQAVGRIGGQAARAALQGRAAQGGEGRLAAAWGLRFLRPADWPTLQRLAGDAEPGIVAASLAAIAAQDERPPATLEPVLCRWIANGEAPALQRAAARVVARFATDGAALCAAALQAQLTALQTWIARSDLASAGDALVQRVALLAALGPRLGGDALVALTRRAYLTYRAQAVRWVSHEGWRQLEGGPATRSAAQPRRPPAVRDKRKALAWLLARFPERRNEGEADDPLLPPAVGPELVEQLLAALPATVAARRLLAEVALEAPRRVRIAALRRLGELPASTPASAPASRPTSSPTSRPTSTLAGQPPADAVARAVWGALRGKDKTLRRAAALACPQLGSSARSTALGLLGDRDFEVRGAAARCLGQVGGQGAVPALLEALRAEPTLEVLGALARSGDHQATPALLDLLREDHPATRQGERVVVIEALGQLADPSAAAALERELAHPSWEVRLAAARALTRAGRSRSLAALDICQTDFHERVRRACRRSQRALAARAGSAPARGRH